MLKEEDRVGYITECGCCSCHSSFNTCILLRHKSGLPEFEKEDRFKMNVVNCALLVAFVLNMLKCSDVKRLTTYYAGSMMIPAMKWFCRKSGKSKYPAACGGVFDSPAPPGKVGEPFLLFKLRDVGKVIRVHQSVDEYRNLKY